MGWPQWTLICLMVIGLLINANRHGKPRDPWNFWHSLAGWAIEMALLWFGGFWK